MSVSSVPSSSYISMGGRAGGKAIGRRCTKPVGTLDREFCLCVTPGQSLNIFGYDGD